MKVLITTDWYEPVVNGVVRSVLNLKKYLEKLNCEVKVLTLSNEKHSYKENNIYYIGSLSAGVIYPDARVSIALKNDLIKEIISWKPDVIHSQCEFSTFFMANKISNEINCPLIHTYHTIYEKYTHYFSPSKKLGRRLVKIFTKSIAKRTDFIIAPSVKTKNILKSYKIKPEKIKVIPTGIEIEDENYEDFGNNKVINLRKKFSLKENDKIILYLGRIAKEKNIDEIIDYYLRLDDENIKLVIVGGGPYLKDLKEKASTIDKKIIFTGMVKPKDVFSYYKLADCFVSASNSETQGLTYYEALSSGIVCICRRDDCLEGIIIDDFNGFQYSNFYEFKEYIDTIFKDEKKLDKMKRNAKEFSKENFTAKSFAKKVFNLYEKAMENDTVNI
ncbi:MAG: glycosyltransferase [Peptoniphilaceae bacterium]|nr:glycosyltransferase [Peptoniphilaceae bacterium]MDD7383083.1 glycosyltransferase [Peptoniphilaceae bacterium]MDY3737518.1 glycosyltransferase [Peptoniphilaceae bacterium]